MKVAELKDRFLVALYQSAREDGAKYANPEYVARKHGLHLPQGFDELVVEQLRMKGWVSVQDSDPLEDNTLFAKITWEGVEAAEELLEEHPNYSTDIPASDRYVTLADNQRGEIEAALRELTDETRAYNDVEEEDRLIALSEIAAFEATIAQPRVSTELVRRFVNKVLAWLTKAFVGAALALVAKKLIEVLMPFLA